MSHPTRQARVFRLALACAWLFGCEPATDGDPRAPGPSADASTDERDAALDRAAPPTWDDARVDSARTLEASVDAGGPPPEHVDASHPIDARSEATAPGADAEAGTRKLLTAADLEYEGAFRLPGGALGASSFDYGGTALAYHAANHSLFLVGHDWHQMVAEVEIPALKKASSRTGLETAKPRQSFTDVTQGRLAQLGPDTNKIGGLLVHGGRLLGTGFEYYDAAATEKLSHFVASTDFASGAKTEGLFQVGALGGGYVGGYMATIPAEWQVRLGGPLLTGQCGIPIVTRTSFGPAAFSFDPSSLRVGSAAPAQPLVYYTEAHATLGRWDEQNAYFNGTSGARGVAFPSGTSSLLFFGTHGTGPFCYGVGGASGGDCVDPVDTSKGNHAYPYVHQVWAYDAQALADVKAGTKNPWDVTPYAIWQFDLPFQNDARIISGVAYDDAAGRVYLASYRADGDLPLIHAYRIRR